MSKIIYTQENGIIAVVHPTPQSLVEMTIEEIAQKVVPVGISTYSIVEDSVIPTDRTFRDAWIQDNKTIKTDMAKAREIHKTKIREARTSKLAELDIEFQKALETGASTTDIVSKKQALRDAPADSAIASADTEAKLKGQWNTSILGDSPYS